VKTPHQSSAAIKEKLNPHAVAEGGLSRIRQPWGGTPGRLYRRVGCAFILQKEPAHKLRKGMDRNGCYAVAA
jgi:hypothetical protein